RVCPHPVVVRVSGMGLGNGGQRAGALLLEEIQFSHGAERAHSPDHAEGRRKRDVPHRGIDGVSATATGQGGFARAHESAGRATEKRPGNYGCKLRAGETSAGGRGFNARVNYGHESWKSEVFESKYRRKKA